MLMKLALLVRPMGGRDILGICAKGLAKCLSNKVQRRKWV
jgi:hypothetical protein